MRVSIIGTGYVGITTGACLASKGHDVICVDKQKKIVDTLNSGSVHIYEPGLDKILQDVIKNKRLEATLDIDYAIKNTDLTIISVGTPYVDGKIDLSYIEQAAYEIGKVLKTKDCYHVVCVKSTVVPSTTDTIVKNQLEKASGKTVGEFGLAMNPEFLREGSAVSDFLYPDRIVIGAYDEKSYDVMQHLYSCFNNIAIIRVNLRTAELIKYTSNSLLAMLISFSNEMANIAEKTGGIDVKEVLSTVALDKRINPIINDCWINPPIIEYLKAGCGFGGSCFPKDVSALISFASQQGYTPKLLDAIMDINRKQPVRLINTLEKELGVLKNKKIAVLGLSFKPNTDDIRESPALIIINELLLRDAQVYAVDPISVENAKHIYGSKENIHFSALHEEALKDAEGAILITAWKDFLNIKPDKIKELMKNPLIIDGRRVFEKEVMEKEGVYYIGVGLS